MQRSAATLEEACFLHVNCEIRCFRRCECVTQYRNHQTLQLRRTEVQASAGGVVLSPFPFPRVLSYYLRSTFEF